MKFRYDDDDDDDNGSFIGVVHIKLAKNLPLPPHCTLFCHGPCLSPFVNVHMEFVLVIYSIQN